MNKPIKIKIVAIENDEFMRIFLKDVFWIHGDGRNKIHLFGSFNKAREFLKEPGNKPNLIILGLELPEEDNGKSLTENSFRFLEELKSNPETEDVKIIVFSNFGDKEIEERAIKLGADRFMVKGEYLPREIIRIINEEISA